MDIRQQLLAAFEVEHREHIDAIRAALAGGADGRPPDWNDVFRRAHSLKGAARAVDLPPVEAVAHRLETLFERIVAGETALDREATGAAHLALDRIETFVANLKTSAAPSMPGDALAILDRRLGAAPPAPAAAEPPDAPAAERGPGSTEPAEMQQPPAAAAAEQAADPANALLRVPADAVAALTRTTHELASALSGEAAVTAGLARAARMAGELRGRAEGIRGQGALAALDRRFRETGEDEAASGLDAVRNDLRALEDGLRTLARDVADLSRTRSAVTAAVEGASSRVRAQAERLALVPAETVFGGFARSLRETARGGGREVEITVRGLDLPVDRAMLQILKDPVLHALRNALSHGAETPEARRRAGKPPTLAITFEVGVRGGRLVIGVHDDGRGPDLPAIEATARRRGLLAPGEAVDPDGLLALVFEPGFSTAAAIDTLSGRGVGLLVVADAVRRLHGTVRLSPRAPWGASLSMNLPLSAALRTVLLVEAGGATYALPSQSAERLLRVDRAGLDSVMGRTLVRVEAAGTDAATLPIFDLADLIGGGRSQPTGDAGALTAILLRSEGRRCVLAVDRLHDVRTLLVLPPPPIGADPRLIAGTVVPSSDVPVLLLDPEGLIARTAEARTGAMHAPALGRGTMAEARRSTILVVDDSITTRTLEKGILEAAGYRVVVCVDGQDALDRLHAGIEAIDLVVADVEMPRLDGFGLLAALRAEDAFATLPVILMTSRGASEDVTRGLELGADAYLTKQKFDQRELLDTIGQLL